MRDLIKEFYAKLKLEGKKPIRVVVSQASFYRNGVCEEITVYQVYTKYPKDAALNPAERFFGQCTDAKTLQKWIGLLLASEGGLR